MNFQPYLRAFLFLIIFSFILGIVYPLLITGVSQVLFSWQSHGSLVINDSGDISGSELIGLSFSGPEYFEGRPSGIPANSYPFIMSGGSNYGPTNPKLFEGVQNRTLKWRENGFSGDIPSDLVMTSASGIDPHLSVAAALLQVPMVAKARNLSPDLVRDLVLQHKNSDPSLFAEPYVQVFSLNRALDRIDRGKNAGV